MSGSWFNTALQHNSATDNVLCYHLISKQYAYLCIYILYSYVDLTLLWDDWNHIRYVWYYIHGKGLYNYININVYFLPVLWDLTRIHLNLIIIKVYMLCSLPLTIFTCDGLSMGVSWVFHTIQMSLL